MGKKITVMYQQAPCYTIQLESDFGPLSETLKNLGYGQNKACIVTDTKVGSLYLQELEELLSSSFSSCTAFVFEEGENSKNTDTAGQLYQHLIEHLFDRKDVLIALGGGVTGDLTGFVAATYLRGIDFVQVPTSLLAQVDSSIGGKTGVDFLQYKNMVGAFYMPKLVYMNLSVLKTLPDRQLHSGMGEIIKHGCIKDSSYFSFIQENSENIRILDLETIEAMVYRSCEIKSSVVEADPLEQGERALLNFGHTIGHAIEKLSDFSLYHGECVALGMVGAAYISYRKGTITQRQLTQLEQSLSCFGLPTRLTEFPHTSEEVLAATKLDKKMESGKVKFILLNTIGEAYMTRELTEKQILEGIAYVVEGLSQKQVDGGTGEQT